MNTTPSISRRNVFLTVHTASSDPLAPELSLTPKNAYICIGVLIDDGVTISEACFEGFDQEEVLGDFWQLVQAHDLVIGYNVEDRLAFLRQRSWELDLVPSLQIDLRKIYAHEMLNTLTLWASCGNCDYLTTEELAQLLGIRRKVYGSTSGVASQAARKPESIIEDCRQDAKLTYEAFYALTRQNAPNRYTEWYSPLLTEPNTEITIHSRG